MTNIDKVDEMLRAAYSGARNAQTSPGELDEAVRALEVDRPRHMNRPSLAALALALVIFLAGAAAVPPVRAAVDDIASEFSGYFDGDDDVGRSVSSTDNAPTWLDQEGSTGQRVLAESGGHQLFIVREANGGIAFGLDDSIGIASSAETWAQRFVGSEFIVLNPVGFTPGDRMSPVFGLASDQVQQVIIKYDDGSQSSFAVSGGGFVAIADVSRGPVAIEALDESGKVVDRRSLDDLVPAK